MPRHFRRIAFNITRVFQLAVITYGIINVELTVSVNRLESSENQWEFGQIAAMVNLLGTALLVAYRLLRSLTQLLGSAAKILPL